jgi:hypothetical protein
VLFPRRPLLGVLFIHARSPNPLVFSVPTHTHAAYQIKVVPRNIKKYIFRMKVDPLPPLYEPKVRSGRSTQSHTPPPS